MAKTANRRHTYAIALRGGTSLSNAALALLLVPGLAFGSMASAQTILPPAPPPGGPVSGPPDGAIPPGPPIRLPTPAPAPAPTPAPTPTPPPASPTPTPTPAPAPPRERPQPPREAQARPAQPAPANPTPIETPSEAAPAPVDENVVPPVEPTVATPAPASDTDSALPSWWPYALGAALLALLGGWWALRRRRAEDQDEVQLAAPAPAPTPTPAPLAKQQAPKPKPPAPVSSSLSARIEPLTASTTLVNLRLRYALILDNPTADDISIIGHADTVLAGIGAQEATIRQWFTTAPRTADVTGIVPAKGQLRLERELAVPLGQLSAMQIRGRTVMIPVLLLSLAYRHATGLGQLGRAFVIGKPGSDGAKLGALPLDQGMGGFGPLAARDTGISQTI